MSSKNEVIKLNKFALIVILPDDICTFFHICIQTIHPVPVP